MEEYARPVREMTLKEELQVLKEFNIEQPIKQNIKRIVDKADYLENTNKLLERKNWDLYGECETLKKAVITLSKELGERDFVINQLQNQLAEKSIS